MEHGMRLQSAPFAMIKRGIKTYELRLYDEKRAAICEGDFIRFTEVGSEEALLVRVLALHRFPDFAALYAALPLLCCGYTEENVAAAASSDMDAYYSKEEQKLYGVVAIEIELCK